MSADIQPEREVDRAACHDAARHAVLAAAEVCRAVQLGAATLRSVIKDDRSPVTIADFAAQAVVAHTLRERLGSSVGVLPMVGEEDAGELRDRLAKGDAALAKAVLAAARTAWRDAELDDVLDAIDAGNAELDAPDAPAVYWTLDPIDGTKGFLRGQQYAVSLALIEGGAVTVGALACPNLPLDHNARLDTPDLRGSLYSVATDGAGAGEVYESACTRSAADVAQATPLASRVHDDAERVTACGSVEPGHSDFSATDALLARANRLDVPGLAAGAADARALRAAVDPLLVRLDSQAKYAVVARGQADAYLRLPAKPGYREKIWDHAAGSLIARCAGVAVTDVLGAPLDFGRGETLKANRGVIAAPPAAHAALMDAVRDLRPPSSRD